MKRFELVDYYEGIDLLITSDSKEECLMYARQFVEDTDGECDLLLVDNKDKSNTVDLNYLIDEYYGEE